MLEVYVHTGEISLVIIQYCEDIIRTNPRTVCRIEAKETHSITKKQGEKCLYIIIEITNFNHLCGKLKITGSIKNILRTQQECTWSL